jgi:uncharacterized iron-regulated protein
MRYAIPALGLILLFIGGCAKHPEALMHKADCGPTGVYAMQRGQCVDLGTMYRAAAKSPVIFLGDIHNSDEAHELATGLIEHLGKEGYRVHLANEWFTPEDNALLATYADRSCDDGNLTEQIGWKEKAGYDFSLYAPIYHAVQKYDGDFYGMNLTRAERKLISDANRSGMSEELKVFYDQLDLGVTAHRQMLHPYLYHCKERKGCAERIMRVQVAWDTKMAHESAKLAKEALKGDRDRLIVFAGAMHLAHNLGITMRFARVSDRRFVTILPTEPDPEGYMNGVADYLYIYTPEARNE